MRGDGSLYRKARSPFWYASYYLHGKRCRVSTGERSERKARAWLRAKLIEVRASDAPIVGSEDLTVGSLIRFREESYRDKGHKSIKTSLHPMMGILRDNLGADTKLLALNQLRMDAFFDALTRKYAISTLRQVSNHLTAGYREAIDRGLLNPNDQPRIRKFPKPDNARQRAPEPSEILAFTECAPEWMADLTWFFFFSGWRRSEVLGLQWKDIDSDNVIRLRDSKTGQRALPVAGALLEIIEKRRSSNVRSIAGSSAYVFCRDHRGAKLVNVKREWDRALEESGVERFTMHDLRRSSTRNRMQTQGIDGVRVQKIHGWKSGAMLERYNVVEVENLRDVFAEDRIPVHEQTHNRPTGESGDV